MFSFAFTAILRWCGNRRTLIWRRWILLIEKFVTMKRRESCPPINKQTRPDMSCFKTREQQQGKRQNAFHLCPKHISLLHNLAAAPVDAATAGPQNQSIRSFHWVTMEMLGPFSKLSIYIGNTRSIETRCEG
jgi:hypothetical protein